MHGEEGAERLIEQVGKNPTWSFPTDGCQATYESISAEIVSFVEPPKKRPYGVEAVF